MFDIYLLLMKALPIDLLSRRHQFSSILAVELAIARFSLVTLSYQPPLNPRSISYVVYVLNIITTYQYSVHGRSYLTLHLLDWVLPTKQKK